MCGFSNAMTFKAIDDEDIDAVENFVKNDLLEYFKPRQQLVLKTNGGEDNLSELKADLSEEDKHNFFGVSTSNPSNFVFLRGERKMLRALAEHVK